MPTFGRSLQPQDSAYILTPLLPSSAFGGSLGKSSSDTHHSGDASEGAFPAASCPCLFCLHALFQRVLHACARR